MFSSRWAHSWPRRRQLMYRWRVRRIVVVWCNVPDEPSEVDEPRR